MKQNLLGFIPETVGMLRGGNFERPEIYTTLIGA